MWMMIMMTILLLLLLLLIIIIIIISQTRKTFIKFTSKESCICKIIRTYRKYCSLKLEACAVGITVGLREVQGRKGL
jgi:Na+-transporting methylmalonyl-CoA/oxaloacetate decarboxylase gamma subunit